MLSRRLTAPAFLPSTYRVLGFPGNATTTPSNEVPMFGADTTTLLAYGNKFNPSRGKMLKSRSKASLGGGVETLELSSPLSGVSGGVAKSSGETDCLGIFLGETEVR